jgi:RNA polymerase sigma-70 factor (ECF subfamily)
MQSDVELLTAWRAGDALCGERLFDRHFRVLNRFFRSKVAAETDDLVQRTFLACVEGRDRIRDDTHFRAYMFGAARRILYRELRGRLGDAVADLSVASIHDLHPGLETGLLGQEDERVLLGALRRIPVDYQVALELRFWQDLTGPELALALGIPEGTVRTRIRRGLLRLREEVARIEAGEVELASTMTKLADWSARIQSELGPEH